jgi:hypothetical protein
MTWFWLNIPLGALLFLAMSGIPFWMVIRHPDNRPAGPDATRTGATLHAGSVTAAGTTERPGHPAQTWPGRELVAASAGDRG